MIGGKEKAKPTPSNRRKAATWKMSVDAATKILAVPTIKEPSVATSFGPNFAASIPPGIWKTPIPIVIVTAINPKSVRS